MFLADTPESLKYLTHRNIAIFALDIDSFDFKFTATDEIIKSVMSKLEIQGKGIILLNDFQVGTASAMPSLLDELKAKGYRVVHMRTKNGTRTTRNMMLW